MKRARERMENQPKAVTGKIEKCCCPHHPSTELKIHWNKTICLNNMESLNK